MKSLTFENWTFIYIWISSVNMLTFEIQSHLVGLMIIVYWVIDYTYHKSSTLLTQNNGLHETKCWF
jgi:hypothetical protein